MSAPSHSRLAGWYEQLAQQLEAGLPLPRALRLSHGVGSMAERLAVEIERGNSVDGALRAAGTALPSSDRLALAAAADAGRLTHVLRVLAARHAQVATTQRRMVFACLYPIAVLHLGLLLLPVMRMIDWEKGFLWRTSAYVSGVAGGLVPLWALLIAGWILAQRQSPLLMRAARCLPALRGYVRAQSLADLAFALGIFIEAGVPIGRAWATAGASSRSMDLKQAAAAMEQTVARGEAPGGKLAAFACFPPDFIAHYRTGETTGQLDASLARLATQYQESADRSLVVATFLYPALLFLTVAAAVAYFVITMYAGYLKMLTNLAG
jgi:type II secretory pathway component PulF